MRKPSWRHSERLLAQDEEAVVVPAPEHDVIATVARVVEYGRADAPIQWSDVPIGVPYPAVASGIDLLVPTAWSQDVHLAVAVDVAPADTVSGAFVTDGMLDLLRPRAALSQLVPDHPVRGVWQETHGVHAEERRHHHGFHAPLLRDHRPLPERGAMGAGVAMLENLARRIVAGDNIGPPVTVNIDRDIREIALVAAPAWPASPVANLAKFNRSPIRRAILVHHCGSTLRSEKRA